MPGQQNVTENRSGLFIKEQTMSKEPKHTPDCTFQLDGGGVCDCGYHKKPKVELSKTDINTCPKCGREQFQWSGRGKIWECLYSNCGYHQRETKAELAEITKTNVAFLVDRQRMAEATMSDWPKEMNATELQFYHRSAYSLPVAFRLGCREIDRLTAELDTARDLIDDMNRLDNHMSLTDRGCNTCTHKADCDKGYADCEEWECMTVAEYIIKAEAEIAQLKAELAAEKAKTTRRIT